jgi:putative transposase
MARALRVQFEGAIYHVTSRGNERRDIFRTDRDRQRFLEILAENVEAYHIRLYAYVLMSNHFHLLIETPRANLCAFMQQFNGAYTTWFNAKHKRSGHLYGGRYKARLVEGDEYLLALTRYVHLNPVKIKSVKNRPLDERRKRLRGYPWSSYRSYAGLTRKKDRMVDHGPLSELVGQASRRKEVAYRRYVEAGLAKDDKELQEALKQSSKAIGTGPFCRWVDVQYQRLVDKQGQPLDAAMRRMEIPASPDEVKKAVCEVFGVENSDLRQRRSASDARLVAMKLLKEEAGLTQREVAVELGLRDGSTISRKLSELSERLKKERMLYRKYVRLRNRISHKH